MLLNQLPKVKNPSEYNSVLVSKQLDKLQSVINGRVEGFFFFFFPFSSDLHPDFINSRAA